MDQAQSHCRKNIITQIFLRNALLMLVLVNASMACKTIKSLREIKKETAKVYSYSFGNKEIKYIPMHHLGKNQFYDDVKMKINQLKKEGYTVYYEEISSKFKIDSLAKDTIRRKVRKIKGFSGGYDDAAKGSFLEKYVKQPAYKDLGISDSDMRADVNYLQFIHQWEKINGPIILDSLDLNTPFDKPYSKGSFYSKKQYNAIIIEYRNQYLIDLIKASEQNKLLVVYGEGHRKGFAKKIKQLNAEGH